MAKNVIIQTGEITQALSNATFNVELENGMNVFCTISGRMRQNYIRVMPGDSVEVEMSPYDLTKGRISKRLKAGNQNTNIVFTKKKVR